ncbi:thiolase family protein [Kocuria indica]|uniref:thiolase family protein n=1 Tax=Kocuria TaxID=57493 RepID=UPI0007EAD253|nr:MULTISPECIES: thiolase family protein [Kocuria]MBN6810638.1 thiolase family protein [Kocuria indica]MBN6842734.1 thiolase family protein [Kocuria indica]MCG7431210.1 thiolase family protein [Kocuria indica]MCT1723522.1 thiolase family protein [Kocuria marina]MCT1734484.1 thiolase family protein [Kocuria marina]
MNHAYVYDAIRTPFGKVGGALASHRPDDLAALVVRTLVERAPELDPATIDEVYLGNANGAGEENRNVARMATLLAGLPVSVPGSTINRLCGSSLDAAMMGSRQIEVGEGDLLLVGGVESMSRAPWVLPKTERPYPMQNLELANTTLGWRLVNPDMPSEWTVSLGEATEQLREKHGISREDQDAFAATSHQLAAKAWDEGKYDDITVSVAPNTKKGVELTRDETVRGDSTPETLAGLRTVFRSGDNATVTAGNSSPMNDGASAVWLGSERGAQLLGREPIARIAGRGAAANEPQFFGEAPVEAANIAVRRAGITWDDVAAVELNEAFAAQSLACLRQWGVDQSIVNQWGGAIAIGHPLGASGTRVLGTLARRLQESGQRWGVASLCIGVGQGLAVVLENENAQG